MTIHRGMPAHAVEGIAEICIIGAGAAGITLACELDGSGIDVLLLDAGGLAAEPERTTDTYAGRADPPHAATHEYRRIGLGGTTRIWGGRCVPFDPIDFERRDHVPHSGWPIAYEDVARHYPRALAYCHGGTFDYSVDGAIAHPRPTLPGLRSDDPVLIDRIERYSLPTHFGRDHRRQLSHSKNVDVVLEARCIRLHKRVGEDAIESAEIVDAAGTRRRIRARRFVLAVGGIETPRMLFGSDPDGNGFGNAHDRLGRFYACHFENVFARLVAPPGAPVAFAFEKTIDGVYARRKLQFTADAQQRHRLLNSAFRLHFPDYSDASHGSAVMSAIFMAKSTLIPEYQAILRHGVQESLVSARSAHVRNVVAGLPQLARFGSDWLVRRVLAKRKLPYTLIANADGSYPLEFNSEQSPDENSRIVTGPERDRDGVPRVHIQWRLSDDDMVAGERAFRVLRDGLANTTACRVEFDDDLLAGGMRAAVPVGGHHIGTARMAATERDGVVDRDCAVYGLSNLSIASAAVFPTSSHANPTLTIVAMAVRLAATLRTEVARR